MLTYIIPSYSVYVACLCIFVHVTFPVSISNIFFFFPALKNYYFSAVFCDNAPFSDKKMFCTP